MKGLLRVHIEMTMLLVAGLFLPIALISCWATGGINVDVIAWGCVALTALMLLAFVREHAHEKVPDEAFIFLLAETVQLTLFLDVLSAHFEFNILGTDLFWASLSVCGFAALFYHIISVRGLFDPEYTGLSEGLSKTSVILSPAPILGLMVCLGYLLKEDTQVSG